MKRIVVFLAMALMAFFCRAGRIRTGLDFRVRPRRYRKPPRRTLTPSPTPAPTPIPADSGDAGFDFSQVDNPLATPVAVNPIDMPTPDPHARAELRL